MVNNIDKYLHFLLALDFIRIKGNRSFIILFLVN